MSRRKWSAELALLAARSSVMKDVPDQQGRLKLGGVVLGVVVLGGVIWGVRHITAPNVAAGQPVPKQFSFQIDSKTMAVSYSTRGALDRCLFDHGVPSDKLVASQDQRAKYSPHGVQAELWIIGSLTPGFSSLRVYFFGTATEARQGARQLAALDVYGQGIANTSLKRALEGFLKDNGGLPKAPSLPQADKLETVYGNAVAIWGYPHAHLVRSTRILDGCLATTA